MSAPAPEEHTSHLHRRTWIHRPLASGAPTTGALEVAGGQPARVCTAARLKRAYRKQLLKYHPDKWSAGPKECAQTMALLLNAGHELITKGGECG